MDLAEICRVMGRRWYVLLPGLLLTAILVAGAYTQLAVTYTSQSTVALLNSVKATKAFDGNPFLSTQTSLTGMADMLARNLNSDDSVAALRARGASGTPAAKIADNAQGPLLWLTVSGTDRAAVLRSDQVLTEYAAKRLGDLQTAQSVASPARIRMVTIVPPQEPVAQLKTRYEYLSLAGIAGVVLTLIATFYVEARFRRPAAGTQARGAQPAGPGTPPAPERDTGSAGNDAGDAYDGPGSDRAAGGNGMDGTDGMDGMDGMDRAAGLDGAVGVAGAPGVDAARAGEPYLAPMPDAVRAAPDRGRRHGRPRTQDRSAAPDRTGAQDRTAADDPTVTLDRVRLDGTARPAPRWSVPPAAGGRSADRLPGDHRSPDGSGPYAAEGGEPHDGGRPGQEPVNESDAHRFV